ncbi:MAG TPA: DUF3303 family protein [Fimbriimonadaceae bacterium]|nr:DUF3303 family protein [Fimbriimonadaceae bacterium]
MLYMVIERWAEDTVEQVGKRFEQYGRHMPEGVSYVASWVDAKNLRCFQVMEAESRALLDEWISHWDDLVHFEVVPVVTSKEFWEARDR